MSDQLLEIRSVGKSFFGAHALVGVSLSLAPGEVLGLVGENGAGKSTLMNVLGGIVAPDEGEMRLAGQSYQPRTADDATRAGIAIVHQELNLFANLTIAENLFLNRFPERRFAGLRCISRRKLHGQTREWLAMVGLELDPATPLERLSPGERQLVEIAKALSAHPRILVLDEPTTSLARPQARRLFEIIERLRASGASVIYISHNLGDVLRLCNRVVVLRDGRVQGSGTSSQFTIPQIISLMVGRSLDRLFPSRSTQPSTEPLLEARHLSQPGVVENVNFTLYRGEVLGISGLMGSGRTELARVLFGLDPHRKGEVLVRGQALARPKPRRSIARGIAFLSEDRRGEGLLMDASVADNVVLASLGRHAGPLGWITQSRADAAAAKYRESLGIECRSLDQPVRTLSGGNQQKVVLARWLMTQAGIFILDEPTRGVDVGARYEIYEQINALVADGAGVLVISSELEELVGLCDRILVMSRGKIHSVVEKQDFDRSEMLRSAIGEERLQ